MADLKVPRLNKCIFSGRIGNDVELKYTPKGVPVVRLLLPVIAVTKMKPNNGKLQPVGLIV